uniref:Sulfatase N-terminal domain-containing protein n=1 Tax=Octactis speculum TaxID=3111310 RepID=A0A7S2MLX8_9STRA
MLLDDAGWNDIGYNSYDMARSSPVMDKLALEGVKLDNYYSQPQCTPTRASLMTGNYPISIGMQHDCITPASPWGLPLEYAIMPEMLQQAGYRTHMVGKWDLGHVVKDMWPTNRGFDSWLGFTCKGLLNYFTYDNSGYPDIQQGFDALPSANGTYSTTLFRNESISVLTTHAEKYGVEHPLFLYIAFNAIHDTITVPGSFKESELNAYITENITYTKRQKASGALYLADEAVGAVVHQLKELDYYKNSVLVVISDNGGSPSDGSNNWPLRGAKKTYFQGGVRVFGFVHSPLLIAAGRGNTTVKSLFHVSDWVPTLVEGVAGYTTGETVLDGVNQWNVIMNGKGDDGVTPIRTEVLHNIDYMDTETGSVIASEPKHIVAAMTAQFDDLHLYKVIIHSVADNWYEPFSNDAVAMELDGTSTVVDTDTFNVATNETHFLFDISTDPYEIVNLWDHQDFQNVRRRLIDQICVSWETRMVDTVYRPDVEGTKKKRMKAAFKGNDGYITWYENATNITSMYTLKSLEHSIGISGCVFRELYP